MLEDACTIAYDPDLKRPGCAVVQAGFGTTIPASALQRLHGWATAPTAGMRVFLVSPEQFEQLVEITNGTHKDL